MIILRRIIYCRVDFRHLSLMIVITGTLFSIEEITSIRKEIDVRGKESSDEARDVKIRIIVKDNSL